MRKENAAFLKNHVDVFSANRFHKVGVSLFLVLLLLLQSLHPLAQYVDFVENKGQWTSNILFRGALSAGAIALKPDGGYRVMLENRSDLQKIADYSHAKLPAAGDQFMRKVILPGGTGETTIDTQLLLHTHAYEIKFLNANPHPAAVAEKQLARYNNYFIGNDSTRWAAKCGIYTTVTFKDVYPGIDVRYYSTGGTFKYDIIVNAGGDVSKVLMVIEGADKLSLDDGRLVIKTSVDDVKEELPNSYEVTKDGNKQVKCRFSLHDSTVSFKFNEYVPPGTQLVIDPAVVFCSFSGSRVDNWGYTATYDASGNFYAGGIAFGTGFQFSNGAFQKTFAGGNNGTGEGRVLRDGTQIDTHGFDIGIMKFNSTGTSVMYATYIGGADGNEQPHSLVVDANGDLIIAGRTTSADYPTKAPFTIGTGGGQDIILTKLSADGSALLGSLRIGGTGDDGVNIRSKDLPLPGSRTLVGTVSTRRNYGDDARSEVILDGAGNIYLASSTQSRDFPLVNAFDKSLGGNQDAVLIKFPPGLNSSPLFSTYLGGNGDDAAFVLALDPLNSNIYVGGATGSTDFPGASRVSANPVSGAFLGGDCDGFVSMVSNDGSKLIKSVYFGTGQADQVYGIDFTKSGNPIIMGTTEGLVAAINSPFNTSEGQDQGKQFITKLKPDLSGVVYSANFGPANGSYPNISPTAFLVDQCENVYVSGWGGGLDGGYTNSGPRGLVYKPNGLAAAQLTATPEAKGSFYFFVLERNASSQLFGAFLGDPQDENGIHVDGGTSRFDKSGIIYQAVCACGSDRSLPTANAAYSTNQAWANSNGFSCNLTSIKIAFNFAGVKAAVKSSIRGIANDTSGCVPVTITFTDTIGNAQKYIWRFGDGGNDTTTAATTVLHTYNTVGNYRVRLIAVDSNSCNIRDTSFINIRVRNDPASLAFTYTKLPPCDAFNYVFTNQSSPASGKPFNGTSFLWNFGDGSTQVAGPEAVQHHFASAGSYNIVLTLTDTSFCNAPESDSLQLRISSVVTALFNTPAIGCVPYIAQFNNTSLGGQQFFWDFGDGSTSTQTSPAHLYSNTGTYTVKLVAVDSVTCNKIDSTTFVVKVIDKPAAGFSFGPQPPQVNTPVNFTNFSTDGDSFKWNFGDGSSLFTVSLDTPVSHQYNKTATYSACLIDYDNAGCSDTVCQAVAAIIHPLLDVPNALSPNGDGINDEVHVRGFGIDKMDWRIYNRWGTIVFRSADQKTGWDGRYKGVLQPQEVYTYILDVQFTDGTKYTKKGDITLLR